MAQNYSNCGGGEAVFADHNKNNGGGVGGGGGCGVI